MKTIYNFILFLKFDFETNEVDFFIPINSYIYSVKLSSGN
jgi:hypothetical protein